MLKQRFLKNFKKNKEGLYEIYDRFSFDTLFKLLLNNGFEPEDALNFILTNCALSTLVFQERIYKIYDYSLKFQEETHKKFTEKYGGRVFYVISIKDKQGRKIIYNQEVIEEIKSEIKRLKNL